MPEPSSSVAPMRAAGRCSPWSIAGGPDPDFDDAARTVHHALLTDPGLRTHFDQRFPQRGRTDYDEMVRLLNWVWDCPHDGAAAVTGFRCGGCRRTRAEALAQRAVGAHVKSWLARWLIDRRPDGPT